MADVSMIFSLVKRYEDYITWRHLSCILWNRRSRRNWRSRDDSIDIGDKICWWQLWDVGDAFDLLRHQHFPSLNNHRTPTSKKCHQYRNSVIKIQNLCSQRNSSTLQMWNFGRISDRNFRGIVGKSRKYIMF